MSLQGQYLWLTEKGRLVHDAGDAHPFEEFLYAQARPLLAAQARIAHRDSDRSEHGNRLVVYPFELADPAGFSPLSRDLGRFAVESALGAATVLLAAWRDGPVIDSTGHFHDLVWWVLEIVLGQKDVLAQGAAEVPFIISIGRSEFSVVGLHPAAVKPSLRFSHPALLVQPATPPARPPTGDTQRHGSPTTHTF